MKLSLHCQGLPGWAGEFLRRSGAGYVKLIDPPQQDPGWTAKTIGRTFMPDADSNRLIWRGKDGAREWFTHWLPFYRSRRWVYGWEAPNEPAPPHNVEFATRLNEFTVELCRLMEAERLRLVGLNLAVGWPFLLHFDDPPPRARYFKDAVKALADGGHYLGLHEYSAPAMWDDKGAHCLRYRHTVEELRQVHCPIPRILIGECGIDGGVLKPPRWGEGWMGFTTIDEYLAQLLWYELELQKDDYVEAGFIFGVEPNQEWERFRFSYEMAMRLAGMVPPAPSPTLETEIREARRHTDHALEIVK